MASEAQDGAVRIQLLGRFGVNISGDEIAADAWPGRRAAELVQLLALADGHRLTRDQVIEALWPHLEAEAGAANLRKAARGRAFAATIRGEAKLLAGQLDEADADLAAGVELHREIAAATGESFALQRRAEVALHRGLQTEAHALLDEALAIARESDVGFHLLDRIYGTRVAASPDPPSALAALEEAEAAVRGPVETCPAAGSRLLSRPRSRPRAPETSSVRAGGSRSRSSSRPSSCVCPPGTRRSTRSRATGHKPAATPSLHATTFERPPPASEPPASRSTRLAAALSPRTGRVTRLCRNRRERPQRIPPPAGRRGMRRRARGGAAGRSDVGRAHGEALHRPEEDDAKAGADPRGRGWGEHP